MRILQKDISLRKKKRGAHLVTEEIYAAFPAMADIKTGIANIFIKHTSASLAINENADPDVRTDFENYINRMVPENKSDYLHTAEGSDDMTSHIKSILIGSSLSIPIKSGKFALGIWQGIYLCEHRNNASSRNLTITIIGE